MAGLTPKGAATRDRIVRAATDLILERGVGGMTLDEIRAGTATSKSQLFHYFPDGKRDLVAAIAEFQSARVEQAQRPWLDHLDSWESWHGWRDAVVAHYRTLTHLHCSIGALVNELTPTDPALAATVAAHADRWLDHLAAGVRKMRAKRLIKPEADPEHLAMMVFAALQGGLLVMQMRDAVEPLEAALDGALLALQSQRS
ncbi:TetR/AcrR family transcriptional regulator [Actinoplanes sp. L3-i22]|uniref:TetR/AcrR family transcriptional regulator n=1 Tax=Actinoplanes sp. L3-i22 TaxID=2836373 RepID=UPI001C78E5A0|nr:TetR/AcrR family transcriptional regulator [Actinoplanes sp. L3-i22]BCY10089.1 TetR family transcriptional regulator [Actinoplanes sp. L3-i22]